MSDGRVFAFLIGLTTAWVRGGEAPPHQIVHSAQFDVEYEVGEVALPLTTVELWYRRESGSAWECYGKDADRQSPVRFVAPSEGFYELFLIAGNTTGISSQPPLPKSEPHLRVFVDSTPPAAQLHPARIELRDGRRVLVVRWSALDAHLLPRGIELSYQGDGESTWRLISDERLSNSGQYDWLIPADLTGLIRLRLRAYDRGGHAGEALSDPVDVTAPVAPQAASRASVARSTTEAARAARLLAEAREARQRRSLRLALARATEAARLDPTNVEAIAELGSVLYDLGERDRAGDAFELALGLDAGHRESRSGFARVLVQRHELERAGEHLQYLVGRDPNDARTWMDLGDVMLKRGDDVGARECYHRAATADPRATDVAAAVQKRLDNLDVLRRRFSGAAAGSD
ncbi:MAG: hypothetical protein FLDDKLPJ_00148 [Phycisphaerae bacterium]|nr:hypothetical protein [Phycisphaerae bacterium]